MLDIINTTISPSTVSPCCRHSQLHFSPGVVLGSQTSTIFPTHCQKKTPCHLDQMLTWRYFKKSKTLLTFSERNEPSRVKTKCSGSIPTFKENALQLLYQPEFTKWGFHTQLNWAFIMRKNPAIKCSLSNGFINQMEIQKAHPSSSPALTSGHFKYAKS